MIIEFSKLFLMDGRTETVNYKVASLLKILTHPTVTSKMLLPTEEDTAISPNPFLATITLVIKSGIEVPAAKNVKPIT